MRPSTDPWLAAATARLRGVRSSPWLLAAVALLLVAGMAGLTRPPTTTPPGPAAAGGMAPDLLGAATGATGTADAGAAATAATLLADESGIDLPGVADLVGKGILVLALLLITLRLLRHFSTAAGPATARLVVLESRPLAQRATLHLVAIGERRLVIGLTPSGLVSLADLTVDELPDEISVLEAGQTPDATELAGRRPAERFAGVLADLAGRWGVVR